MAEITFYTNPQSRGRIVHWLLEERGVPYDMKILDFEKGEHKKPEYLRINPMGKVPAIVHRGVVVTEAAAICTYLADAQNALETALTPGPFILGERFSAADVYVGAQVQWGLMVKGLEPRPKFQQYAERIAARPALQKSLKGAQSS
jgi:glutathione S-transferase